ncbi:unnamed protein product [Diplocarpon coronariae]
MGAASPRNTTYQAQRSLASPATGLWHRMRTWLRNRPLSVARVLLILNRAASGAD